MNWIIWTRSCVWMGPLGWLELCGAMVWRCSSLTQAYSKALLAGEAAIVFEAFYVLLNHEKIVGWKKKKSAGKPVYKRRQEEI